MLTKKEMPACPVATTVSLIGSKWKLLIIRNLLARPWRFNELKKRSGRNQPESIDGQSALFGKRRADYPNCLPRSAAESGICPFRAGFVHEADHRFHGGMGNRISKAAYINSKGTACQTVPFVF